ncbi:hypothetical protein O1W68_19210 [Rhodococcus sp. H36-A4]|uniref:hypothetical protein n=1 Tax=Rhodococcus sp. H36-A4 TaxID=3004353 RepID=UPI0022AF3810|nr:hypothetical protein [Rhodococcus sp. H36-A4]MCZ4080080.1 hypothetical protein [Rhodococcus sp. H36-A4]
MGERKTPAAFAYPIREVRRTDQGPQQIEELGRFHTEFRIDRENVENVLAPDPRVETVAITGGDDMPQLVVSGSLGNGLDEIHRWHADLERVREEFGEALL